MSLKNEHMSMIELLTSLGNIHILELTIFVVLKCDNRETSFNSIFNLKWKWKIVY